ncbi:YbfB/YjiJ family MFS transporter [Parapusillimonas sp. SGNA-6]|nr:YbfB/YjiJ family MFS transporter [Parapusillimonas sp. SGNA-6]
MQRSPSAFLLSLYGFIALAIAMGIGRFAFTPLLPMMQHDAGLGLAEGGWLASANYLGYLVGALASASIPLSIPSLLRLGLLLVVATTALMGITDNWMGWLTWRFIAGAASAWVLVGTATLCLSRLAAMKQPHRASLVFAGVGAGIALAGVLCMALSMADVSSASTWLVLGLVALVGTLAARGLWHGSAAPAASATSLDTDAGGGQWRLVLCYGIFGFGYILPATFLPAQARVLIEDPAVFGLAWPAFGIAAAASTFLCNPLVARSSRRKVWAGSQIVMAAGVLLPVLWLNITAIIIAALCVGATLMTITMLGMQEAQAVGGARARKLIGAMTASFAAGQLVGPLLFSFTHLLFGATLDFALVLAASGLLGATVLLMWPEIRSWQARSTAGSR